MTGQYDAARGRPDRTLAEDAVVERLRALGTELAAGPDADRRAATRARLVAMAAVRVPADAGSVRPSGAPRLRRLVSGALRRRGRLTAGLAGAALTAGALGGLLAAAQGATPGDVLYAVKRGGEQTQLVLAGDAGRGRTLLDLAGTRLTELTELTRDAAPPPPGGEPGAAGTTVLATGPDADVVVDVLATMDRQTARGAREVAARSVAAGDVAPLTELGTWATAQRAGLTALTGAVPDPAGTALTGSTRLAAAVAERATALVAALGCSTGPATAGVDDLGPRPAPCSPRTTGTATRDGSDPAAQAGAAPDGVVARPSAAPAEAARAEPAPAPSSSAAPRSVASGPAGARGTAGAAPDPAGGPHGGGQGAPGSGEAAGRPASPADGAPGRGGPPLPLPSSTRAPAPVPPVPAPARPGTQPTVDLPLPLCVSALGLPVLC